MKKLSRPLAAIASFLSVLAIGGTALAATTVTVTVGPVPLPGVPVEVCVQQTEAAADECITGPAAETVTLTVVVHVGDITPVVVPPTVTPAQCPQGTTGAALQVHTGTAGATISGVVAVTVNGQPVTIPIDQVLVPPSQTVTVFACAGVAPGV